MKSDIITPKAVSIEDALRNLASRLTGRSPAELPRTQEGIVQFMAEHVPSVDQLAEDITKEVAARLDAAKLAETIAEGFKEKLGLETLAESVSQAALSKLNLSELTETVAREASISLAEDLKAAARLAEEPEGPAVPKGDPVPSKGETPEPAEAASAPTGEDKPKRQNKK